MSKDEGAVKPDEKFKNIGTIGNYYGGLSIKRVDGKCYWSIENYDGDHWEQIPKSLYDELVRFNNADAHARDAE